MPRRGKISILLEFLSLFRDMYTGVFLLSLSCNLPSGYCTKRRSASYFGFQCLSRSRTLLCKFETENEGPVLRYFSSSIMLFVKECSPTGGAQVSKPQAAMTSLVPFVASPPVPPAEQQSRRIRTSDFTSSRVTWCANHLTVGAPSFWLLISNQ